jgi:DNA ligase (NAD+)
MKINIENMTEEQLAEEIKRHNKLYWEKAEPEISDTEYDILVRRLRKLNPEHQLIKKVEAPAVESAGKVKHKNPMLSLDKAYSIAEVVEWAKKYARKDSEEFLVEPKYDGISANFENGVLATRGDGETGEDISAKIPLIELEAKGFTGPLNRPARGEIVIKDHDFSEIYSSIKKKNGKPYKNSRNAVGGILSLKDISSVKARGAKLTFVDYDLHSFAVDFKNLKTSWAQILEKIEKLPYPMDGIVIKLKDKEYSRSLGFTAHHPRGQIAFKFTNIREETSLLDVQWSFGKNCLTPVAELAPVEISGITIKHATLHNVQNIIDKDIQIGDTVLVERAGDVIPYIISSNPGKNRKSPLIEKCPCCGTDLKRKGPELACVNPDCFETKLKRLTAAIKNIGIERLGEPNIRQMMLKLKVESLSDIFNLSFDDILKLDGFKAKSANNLMSEISNARKVNDYQLLSAMNIPGIGKNVAKSILANYSIDELCELSGDELSKINGIGPERAGALHRELAAQRSFIEEMLHSVELIQTKDSGKEQTICFTGKMPEKRSFYESMATERGYTPVDSVSGELSLLVAADTSDNSSKLKKARKSGIEIISLQEWLNTGTTQKEKTSPSQKTSSKDNFNDLPLFGF